MKQTLTRNPEYQLGNVTNAAISCFTDKRVYSFRDVTQAIIEKKAWLQSQPQQKLGLEDNMKEQIDPKIISDL